eukprot:TRINITY_DN6186_c1_g1_i2.p1 TRINITY_DN6186_c1_g1~~TRINITY_DN6186_c1_g1_i2.p1  ORF type:complete len:374 (-),score=92.45 TRINITY_DN6186_c1_g1_i2:43-1164(-)
MSTSARVTRSSTRDKSASTNGHHDSTPTTTTTTSTTLTASTPSPTENNASSHSVTTPSPGPAQRGRKRKHPIVPEGGEKISNTNTTPLSTTNVATHNTTNTTTSESNAHTNNGAYTLTTRENLEPTSLSNSSSSITTIIDVTESATNTPQTSNLSSKTSSSLTDSIQPTSLIENSTIPENTKAHSNSNSNNTHVNNVNTPPMQFTLEDEREFQKLMEEELKEVLALTPPSSPQNKNGDDDENDENEKPIPADCMDAMAAFDFPTLIDPKRPIRVEPEPPRQAKKKNAQDNTGNERFLLAGFSELRNLETELYTREIIARLESQVFAFYQSIVRRDSLIKKLIKDIEERDQIIQSIPKELLVNWGVLANLQKRQ